MDQLIGVVTQLAQARNEEDFIDRLNYRFTSYLFAFCSLLITSKLYLGTPIKCWTPNEFKDGWVQYTQDYCLIENTYYLPMDDPHMPDNNVREEKELQYYQWVTFVLVLQAFFFYLPHSFWRAVNWQSGLQVRAIVTETTTLGLETEKRDEALKKLSGHIHKSISNLGRPTNRSNLFMWTVGHCFGANFASAMYIITKVLFLVNIVFQLYILHVFLGFNALNFLDLKLGFNTNWKHTGLFPRSTMCDFEIRTKGNVQRYSVQCVLQLNMFNEKIYLVLYYWLILLFVATICNLFKWCSDLYLGANRVDFARKMLSGAGITKGARGKNSEERSLLFATDSEEQSHYDRFVRMSPDQVLLYRLISSNSGDIATSDVIASVYNHEAQLAVASS